MDLLVLCLVGVAALVSVIDTTIMLAAFAALMLHHRAWQRDMESQLEQIFQDKLRVQEYVQKTLERERSGT